MELLRRALLVGCLLSGLWVVRLAPLDPLVTITPVDFADQQRLEAAAVPDAEKTDAQRRRAEIPLSVYIEEFLQFNVFSATGPAWEQFLTDIDARRQPGTAQAAVFLRPGDDDPVEPVRGTRLADPRAAQARKPVALTARGGSLPEGRELRCGPFR